MINRTYHFKAILRSYIIVQNMLYNVGNMYKSSNNLITCYIEYLKYLYEK